MTYKDDLSTIGDTVDQALAAKNEEILAKDAEIDMLRSTWTPPSDTPVPDPTPTPTPTDRLLKFGYCPDPNTTDEVKRLNPTATVRRSYKPPGAWPSDWNHGEAAGDRAAGLRTAHTMKGIYGSMKTDTESLLRGEQDADIKRYLSGSPRHAILGKDHEPENDYFPNRWDPNLYIEGQVYFRRLVNEINAADGGFRMFGGNLMSSSSSDMVMKLFPGLDVWDFLGYDGYNWPSRAPGQSVPSWRELEEIFDQSVALNKTLGIRFAIFEMGCRKAGRYEDVTANNGANMPNDADAAKQLDWCQKGNAWLRATKPLVATYFHHDWWYMRHEAHLALGAQA